MFDITYTWFLTHSCLGLGSFLHTTLDETGVPAMHDFLQMISTKMGSLEFRIGTTSL